MRAGCVSLAVTYTVALAACGRIDFDATSPPQDATITDAIPTTVTPVVVIPGFTVFAASSHFTLDTTAGDLVIVAVDWNDSAATVAVSSNNVPSYTALPRKSIATGCNLNLGTNVQLWYGVAATSGSDTVTVMQSTGANGIGLLAAEYANLGAPTATTGMIAPSASNAEDAGTLVTSTYALIVVMFHDSVGNGTMIQGPGYEILAMDTTAYALTETAVLGPGNHDVNATLPAGTSDACWAATAAAFPVL